MSYSRKISLTVGMLFLIATLFGAFSLAFSGSLNSADYLANIYPDHVKVIFGVVLVLMMGVAIAGIPVVLYPVLKTHGEISAIAYIVFRSLEVGCYLIIVISRLLLVALSKEYTSATAPDAATFHVAGALLKNLETVAAHPLTVVFSVGALFFYRLLYLSKLVPRVLAAWGFVGALMTLAASILGLFSLLAGSTGVIVMLVLWVPLMFNELALAGWLIFKGFNPVQNGVR